MAKRRNSSYSQVGHFSSILTDLRTLLRPHVEFLTDRRFFHPARRLAPPAAVQRSMRRPVVVPTKSRFISPHVGFAVPAGVGVCVRRKQRREVIMAKGHGGGGKRRMPRRTPFSNVRC